MPTPLLATSLKSATRSLLLSLGMDHVLIDFLAHVAVGAASVFLAILFVAMPHLAPTICRSAPANSQMKHIPNRHRPAAFSRLSPSSPPHFLSI
jgi:hypothetical protein